MMAFRGGAGVAGALFAGMASSALTLVIGRGAVAISRCLSFCIATGAAFVCSRGGCWVSCGVRPVADRGAVAGLAEVLAAWAPSAWAARLGRARLILPGSARLSRLGWWRIHLYQFCRWPHATGVLQRRPRRI